MSNEYIEGEVKKHIAIYVSISKIETLEYKSYEKYVQALYEETSKL